MVEKLEKRIQLPLFVTESNKYAVAILTSVFASGLYLWTNHNPIFRPETISFNWVDQNTPFLPWTIWIYISEYLFLLALAILLKKMENISRFFFAFMTLQVTSNLIFILWPTIYPRELFPIPQEVNSITQMAIQYMRKADAPTNCFPSLHVSSCYLAAFIFLREDIRKFWLMFVWVTLIALSTLTTKQHYFADVVSGLLMAISHHWFFNRVVVYKVFEPGTFTLRDIFVSKYSKQIDNNSPQTEQTAESKQQDQIP